MARVFALDETHCEAALRTSLQGTLRVYDECVSLPQGHRSKETGAFKNVVLNLSATEPELNGDVFSPAWFSGVSAVRVSTQAAEKLLNKDPQKRAKALRDLADAVPSEMEMRSGTVGPELDCSADDRDLKGWQCGFDSPSCCVGLYSAEHSRSATSSKPGLSRMHKVYFLVCKAGGGIAAQTFHSRLCSSLKKGMSLDEALAEGNSPGAQALRRVNLAAQRNRGRILALAANVLGLHEVDTLTDTACALGEKYRVAVTDVNVVTNSLRKATGSHSALNSTYHYYCGCVDTSASQGVVCASNAAEGFVIFANPDGTFKVQVKNDAFNAVPFSSVRIESNKDVIMQDAMVKKEAKKKAEQAGGGGEGGQVQVEEEHPDREWIKERFAWKARQVSGNLDMIPPPLLGTFAPENFSHLWARELGLSSCKSIRMQPELVALSGTEPAKLRAAAKHVEGK